jgi:hypothetical protein
MPEEIMAYLSLMYPQFADIKVAHFDGFNPDEILQRVLEFLNDPAHANYRYIDSHVDYFHPKHIPMPDTDDPEGCFWVEVTIIYTE